MVIIVAVVGAGRGRGKTTLIESLTRRFSKIFRLWTVKHVSGSFDTDEKDTWRYIEAGAEGAIAVAQDRLVILRPKSYATLEEAIGAVPKDVDLVLVEGFRESGHDKILIASSLAEVEEQLEKIRAVFAIFGPLSEGKVESVHGVPVLSLEELSERLNRMVLEDQVKRLPRVDCKKCGYPSCEDLAAAILRGEASFKNCKTLQLEDLILTVDSSQVYLSEFPKNFVKNVVLGMVGSLKGVDIDKAKRITIEVKM